MQALYFLIYTLAAICVSPVHSQLLLNHFNIPLLYVRSIHVWCPLATHRTYHILGIGKTAF